ncbi:MAG TPA: oxygenase MpaB family protein [Ktedonobacteraceae bacterium]|jgi:uncharacterized protein (DUF2236 family)|nr:oxygenase MpaB family protein [Ktedonobacteraceae bacterium]
MGKDSGYFGNTSVTWKLGREAIVDLGGARAVLMQIAHPLVAAGVMEHSRYMTDPFGRAMSTFMLGQMLTFGSTKTAQQAARTINRLHTHVQGQLTSSAGAYQAGTTYHARDPELLLWVQATLVDTVLLMYPLFIGPISPAEQERYYQESKQTGRLLGLPLDLMPKSVDDLHAYVHAMLYSQQLAATIEARQIAHQLFFPPAPGIFKPAMYLHLYLTNALLPEPVRELYGFEWGPKKQLLFETSASGLRTFLRHLPASLRVLPITRHIMDHGAAA